jgi:hypothetical protein
MTSSVNLRRFASRLVALGVVVALYGVTTETTLRPSDRQELRARFQFSRHTLPEAAGEEKQVRAVHPSLKRISAWISSVGAAVALGDADGDGLPNDACLVDPRTDSVVVMPAIPSDRYVPFKLDPGALPYDSNTMAPMGCLMTDLNEDGLMDFLVYYWGRPPIAFLRNRGTPGQKARLGADDFIAMDVVPDNERWYSNAGFVADLDGDGHLDIVIGNYFQDGARILDANANGTESMHSTKSRAYNGGSKHVLLWQAAGASPNAFVRFQEVKGVFTEATNHGWTLGAGAADLDGDLLPEIYFAHDFGPDRLLRNCSTPGHLRFEELEGKRSFTVPASFVLGHDSFKGMGVEFADINGDGIPDIFVSNIADSFALEESHLVWLSNGTTEAMKHGQAPYTQASEKLGLSRSGWGWDARFADFDNDGSLELVQATGFIKGEVNRWPELQALGTGNDSLMHDPGLWPKFRPGDDVSGHNRNAFFVKAGNGRYYDIAPDIGIAAEMNTRGVATADIDGDGRIDFAMANQWGDSYVFRNETTSSGAFLGLHLLLPIHGKETSAFRFRGGHPAADLYGRPAIGSSASITLPDGRRIVAQSDGGSGHSGKRSPDVQFGLGQMAPGTKINAALRWRDSTGAVKSRTIALTPGWYTVLLGI